MLTFFRKYQKIIFIFTTALIILSFTFFGTGPMGGTPPVKEELLVKAIDGSSISLQKVDRMVQFLSSSHLDAKDDRSRFVNLLNDGVLEKQFLGTSLGKLLAEKVSVQIESDMQKTLEKVLSFHPYRHINAPFISAESVWAQFSPESARIAEDLKAQSSSLSTVKKFDLLSQAYVQHQRVPAGFIRKVLAYQEQQAVQGEKDASLPYADLSLLGLHSSKEWVGETYLKAVSQVIINGAAYAKKLGYTISTQEARQTLVSNVREGAQLLSQEVDPQTNFYHVFLNQVRSLGMNEVECIDLWKDIALFRKLFQSSSTLIDAAELQKMSKEQALVEKYSLPAHLQLKDFSSFMKLQIYIDAVSLNKRSKETLLTLPSEFLSLADIEKKAPDLVQREYVLEYSEIDVKKAASQIGLKEMWGWQTGDLGWDALQKQYEVLAKSNAATKEERFSSLEALQSKQRLEVDKFSREQILTRDEERIKKELRSIAPESRPFAISSQGIELPFKVNDRQSFVALLEAVPVKGEMESSESAVASQEKLNFYKGDPQHYYKIAVMKRSPVKKVQTFAEANASGALRRMLDKKLESAYLEVRKKDSLPYMKKDGSWKPLAEVKDKVGLAVFAPVLKAISEEYFSFYGKEPSKEQLDSAEFYAQNCMLSHVKASLAKAKEGALVSQDMDMLKKQWSLVQEKETLVKKEQGDLASFAFTEGNWSSAVSLAAGNLGFFKILQNLNPAPPSQEEMEKVMAPLKKESETKLFDQLFSEIEAKKALSLRVSP